MIFKPHVGGIADVYYTTDDIPAQPTEGEANTKLIAAAPDLLAACEAFVEAWEKSLQLEKTDVALTMAKAAIARAQVN